MVIPALTVFALAACGAPSHNGSTGGSPYNNYTEYVAEFKQAAKRLDLPPDVTWPEVSSSETSNRFAKGVGTTKAELFWFCQWEREWLSTRLGDQQRAAVALEQVKRIKSYQVFAVALDEIGRRQINESIAQAESGDPAGVQADVDANCP